MTNRKQGIDPELELQIREVCEAVRDLLNGPDSDGQFGGNQLTQKVVLEVPRAFVVLASFLAEFNEAENTASDAWSKKRKNGDNIDTRTCQNRMRRYLSNRLHDIMHADLYWLAKHHFLEEPKPLEEITYVSIDTGPASPADDTPDNAVTSNLDDEIPF